MEYFGSTDPTIGIQERSQQCKDLHVHVHVHVTQEKVSLNDRLVNMNCLSLLIQQNSRHDRIEGHGLGRGYSHIKAYLNSLHSHIKGNSVLKACWANTLRYASENTICMYRGIYFIISCSREFLS